MNNYITAQDDTWDLISYKHYGSEFFVLDLIRLNSEYSDVVIFEQGINIKIPEVDLTVQNINDKPPWLRE